MVIFKEKISKDRITLGIQKKKYYIVIIVVNNLNVNHLHHILKIKMGKFIIFVVKGVIGILEKHIMSVINYIILAKK